MADYLYPSFKRDVGNGSIDWDTDSFKVMLVTSAYTPSSSHAKRSDITNEVTGTGYSAGGAALPTPTVVVSGTTAVYDAGDVTWASSTITARGAVVYKSRGGASSADELVGYFDFGADKSSSNGNFIVQWNTGGLIIAS